MNADQLNQLLLKMAVDQKVSRRELGELVTVTRDPGCTVIRWVGGPRWEASRRVRRHLRKQRLQLVPFGRGVTGVVAR